MANKGSDKTFSTMLIKEKNKGPTTVNSISEFHKNVTGGINVASSEIEESKTKNLPYIFHKVRETWNVDTSGETTSVAKVDEHLRMDPGSAKLVMNAKIKINGGKSGSTTFTNNVTEEVDEQTPGVTKVHKTTVKETALLRAEGQRFTKEVTKEIRTTHLESTESSKFTIKEEICTDADGTRCVRTTVEEHGGETV